MRRIFTQCLIRLRAPSSTHNWTNQPTGFVLTSRKTQERTNKQMQISSGRQKTCCVYLGYVKVRSVDDPTTFAKTETQLSEEVKNIFSTLLARLRLRQRQNSNGNIKNLPHLIYNTRNLVCAKDQQMWDLNQTKCWSIPLDTFTKWQGKLKGHKMEISIWHWCV